MPPRCVAVAGHEATSLCSLWRPGSRRIVSQGLQEDSAERRALTHGAGTRGSLKIAGDVTHLKIAGDVTHQIDAGGRQTGEHVGRYVASVSPRVEAGSSIHRCSPLASVW